MPARHDIVIRKGSTYSEALRWETAPIVYKPITGITNGAPAVITCASHGIPQGWRVAIAAVQGMTQINSPSLLDNKGLSTAAIKNLNEEIDYFFATVIDPNTIALNDVISADYKTYTGGGYVVYNTPADLTGFTARMTIRDKLGANSIALVSLTTENTMLAVDTVNKAITITIPAATTALVDTAKGVYDLEMVSPTGVVTSLIEGKVVFEGEATT